MFNNDNGVVPNAKGFGTTLFLEYDMVFVI
jgi:hypothetical protein